MIKELKDKVYKIEINDGKTIKIIDGTSIEDPRLDIKFTVKKTGTIAPNTLELHIFNLNEETRKMVIKKGNLVTFTAGYKDVNGVIFKGYIGGADKTSSDFLAPNWETIIEAKDGSKELKTIVKSKSFTPKTSQKHVINYVAEQMGVKVGKTKGIPKGDHSNGFSLGGPANNIIKKLVKGKADYFITDGVLHIVPIGEPTNENVILLDKTSGLIGTPKKQKIGWQVKSLLRPDINPATYLKVESRSLTGFFIASTIKIEGEISTSGGGDFTMEIDLIEKK